MQKYLEEFYFEYEGAYQLPVYGMFSSDKLPDRPLKLDSFSVSKSSNPFHLEYPDVTPRYETYVFDVKLIEFPGCWRRLIEVVFDELQRHGSEFSWLSLDPGFDFSLLFGDYFARHTYAFCEKGENVVGVVDEKELMSATWAETIKGLEAKWRLTL